MKKQASTAMWTAAALAASLLLSACGGDSGSDEIKGAGGGDDKKASKSASPRPSSTERSVKSPDDIKLAKDAKNVFEETDAGDPKKNEILADHQRRINVIDRVITTGKDTDLLKVYNTGQSLLSADKYILDFANDKQSWAGVTRYYDQKVEMLSGTRATVTYCADETKSRNKHLKTGKLDPNNGGDQNFVSNEITMKRNKDGVWQATSGSGKRGAKECMK